MGSVSLYRYYAHIRLPSALTEEVNRFEHEFQGTSRSVPHITVIKPIHLLHGCKESDLIRGLQTVAETIPAFLVATQGVGFFDGKKNVHYCVEFGGAFRTFIRKLEAVLLQAGYPLGSEGYARVVHPHITLANRISPAQGGLLLQRAKLQYTRQAFLCPEFFFLRIGPKEKAWQTIARFPLPLCSL